MGSTQSDKNNETERKVLQIGSEAIDVIIAFLKLGQHVTNENKLLVDEMNHKQQDLLHDLEIPEKLYMQDIKYLGSQIRDLRKNRRKLKDELLLAEQVASFLKTHPTILDDLQKLRDSLAEQEAFLKNRKYTVRSKLMTTTAIENRKLKEDENKIIMIITKIIKNWSPQYEAIFKNSEGTVPGLLVHTFAFTLNNNRYDYSAAKSACSNFKELFTKEIKGIYDDADVKMAISNMPIEDPIKQCTKLHVTYEVNREEAKVKYIINGTIEFKLKKPKPPQNKKSKKKGKGKKR